MASEYSLETGGKVTPKDKGGPRVGVGATIYARRDSAGAIGLQLRRGDGGEPEAYNYIVRSVWFGPFAAGEEVRLDIAALDLPMPDFTARGYQLRVLADAGAELTTRLGFVATEPYAPAGIQA